MTKNVTLSLPDDTYEKMKVHSDIRWSEVARRAIEERIEGLDRVERLAPATALASEKALAKDWLSKEDEAAWKDL